MLKIFSFFPCALAVALANELPSDCAYEPLPYGSFPTGTGGGPLFSPTGLPSGSPPGPYPGVSYGAPFPTFNLSSAVVGPTGTGSSSAFVPSSSDEGRSGTTSRPSGTAFIPSSSDAGRSGTASPSSSILSSVYFPNSTTSSQEAVTTIYSATTAVTTMVTTVYLPPQSPDSSSDVRSGVSVSVSYSANATIMSSLVTGTITLTSALTPSSSPDSPVTVMNSTSLPGTATSYSLGTGSASAPRNRTSSAASFTWSPYVPYVPGTGMFSSFTPSSSPNSPATTSVFNSSSARATTTHVTIHLNSSITLTLVTTNTVPLTTGSVTISNSSTFSGSSSGGDRSGTASPVTTSAGNKTLSSGTFTASYSSGGRNGTLISYGSTETAPVRSSTSSASPVTRISSSSADSSVSTSEGNRSGTRRPSRSIPLHSTGPYSQFSSFVTSVVSSSVGSSEAGGVTESPSAPLTLPTVPFYGSWSYNNGGGYGGYRGGYKRNGKA